MRIEIWVPGKPQGKGRARSGILMGKGGKVITGANGRPIITHHTPEKTRTYEGLIRSAAIEVMERGAVSLLELPVKLDLEIHYEIATSWPAWKRELALAGLLLPTIKPDSDNVEKACKDALNGVVWRDDCYVTTGSKSKIFSETPGVEIVVTPLYGRYPAQLKTKPAQREHQRQLEI